MMAQDRSEVSKASLKGKSDELSWEIYEIDLKIQQFKQHSGQAHHTPNLKEAKIIKQKEILDLQVKLEYKKAQKRRRRRGVLGVV